MQWRWNESKEILEHVLFHFAAPAVPTSHKVVASPKHKFGLSFISELNESLVELYSLVIFIILCGFFIQSFDCGHPNFILQCISNVNLSLSDNKGI